MSPAQGRLWTPASQRQGNHKGFAAHWCLPCPGLCRSVHPHFVTARLLSTASLLQAGCFLQRHSENPDCQKDRMLAATFPLCLVSRASLKRLFLLAISSSPITAQQVSSNLLPTSWVFDKVLRQTENEYCYPSCNCLQLLSGCFSHQHVNVQPFWQLLIVSFSPYLSNSHNGRETRCCRDKRPPH